jgi:hypothetical protein
VLVLVVMVTVVVVVDFEECQLLRLFSPVYQLLHNVIVW